MILVSDIREEFGRYKRDISDVDELTFLDWCDYINKMAYRMFYKVDSERFVEEITYVNAPNGSQTLPANFKTIQGDGCGVFVHDDEGITDCPLSIVRKGNPNRGYFISRGQLFFNEVNGQNTYTLRYIPNIDRITATTDELIIPDEYNRYVIDALDVMYNQWDETPGAESYADQRLIRCIDEMLQDYRQDVNVYVLESPYTFL